MSNSVNAHGASTEASPLSRAPADQGAGRGREQGEDLSSGHPIHPPSSTSTREAADQTAAASVAGEQTMDGWPTTATAKAMLRQLDADRERSGYWRSRWAEDHSDQAIEAWLRSLLDWLEGAPQPVDSTRPQGPVEGRSVGEIRADLAQLRGSSGFGIRGRLGDAEAVHRLLADVPSLLAEVEAAHRFERSVAVEREALLAKLAAVEALLPGTDEEFPIFPFQLREALGAEPGEFLLIPRAALAAAADATRLNMPTPEGSQAQREQPPEDQR